MSGRQAKILTKSQLPAMLRQVGKHHRHVQRDRVMVLLSVKAGLRAGEIAELRWSMLLDVQGRIADVIELHDCAAKNGGGRTIPIHPELRRALLKLRRLDGGEGPVIRSERGGPIQPGSVVYWFARLYRELGMSGCSSHSGRRTFITDAARLVHRAGGSLRDVQQLAGHRSIDQTQRYIEGDTAVKRRLVAML